VRAIPPRMRVQDVRSLFGGFDAPSTWSSWHAADSMLNSDGVVALAPDGSVGAALEWRLTKQGAYSTRSSNQFASQGQTSHERLEAEGEALRRRRRVEQLVTWHDSQRNEDCLF